MKQLERTIKNPLIGDTVTFLKTAAETDGAYTLVEVELAPGGGNGLHYHVDFEEHFEVLEGTLGITCSKTTIHLKPGETATAPRKVIHRFFNPDSNAPCRFLCTVKPARYFEEMLRIAYGLANEGKTNEKGIPSILPLSILFLKGETYLPGIPYKIQKGIFGLIARIAMRKGVDKELEKYYKMN